jgi:endonuclease-3
MATTINKQRLLTQLLATARKLVDSEPETRPVLEQFIYAICRENASPAQADEAYHFLRDAFFDWNEVRVSSVRELEEAFANLPQAEARAQRLVSFLQEVFETTFSFDLETLHKKGLKQAVKQLTRYQSANDYTCAMVVQRSLGGHALPLDAPSLLCASRLGLVENAGKESDTIRNSLEHLVPKAKGPLLTEALSALAAEYCFEEEPNCPACPMNRECATAQDANVASATEARAHRPKPR